MTISVRDLKVSFKASDGTRLSVLDVPVFDAADGAEVCLFGGSGSGKSTFLNTLAGIVVPDSGAVCLGGVDLTTLSERARDRFRASNVGYVFQNFNLLQGLTARENVTLAQVFAGRSGSEARARSGELLERMGLAHRAGALPSTLSVGEQQRVAIARAVANRPGVVLADEPTANLDEANGDQALKLLREAAAEAGAILVLVTHDRRIRETFRRVIPIREICR